MIPQVTLRHALADDALLGSALGGDTWSAWRVLLLAIMGEALEPAELVLFNRLTGRPTAPQERVEEFWGIIGRRGGKTRAMAALTVYVAGLCDHRDVLKSGERGVALLIAPDMKQARVALDYIEGMLDASPILRQLICGRTAETLSLTTGVDVEVRAASFRRLRGMTSVAILADEAAFWRSDESANPDTEILNAARPSLATTGGPLVAISSPYARRGEVWNVYKRHFGPAGDASILVAQGASRDLNPSLSERVVARAMERDPAAAKAEYLAMFRADIEAFVALEVVEACVTPNVFERAPVEGPIYFGFVDPSGGSADAMTLAVAHLEDGKVVVDAVRERKPPFSPEAVVGEFSETLKAYHIHCVRGDRYGGEFPRELFRKQKIEYRVADKTRSDLYRDLLPRLNSGLVDLLDSPKLVAQIVGLERRVARGGRDSIDHAPGAHDDLANAVAGAVDLAGKPARQPAYAVFGTYGAHGSNVLANGDIQHGPGWTSNRSGSRHQFSGMDYIRKMGRLT